MILDISVLEEQHLLFNQDEEICNQVHVLQEDTALKDQDTQQDAHQEHLTSYLEPLMFLGVYHVLMAIIVLVL